MSADNPCVTLVFTEHCTFVIGIVGMFPEIRSVQALRIGSLRSANN